MKAGSLDTKISPEAGLQWHGAQGHRPLKDRCHLGMPVAQHIPRQMISARGLMVLASDPLSLRGTRMRIASMSWDATCSHTTSAAIALSIRAQSGRRIASWRRQGHHPQPSPRGWLAQWSAHKPKATEGTKDTKEAQRDHGPILTRSTPKGYLGE
jgi:hypothetical protein